MLYNNNNIPIDFLWVNFEINVWLTMGMCVLYVFFLQIKLFSFMLCVVCCVWLGGSG